MLGATMWSNGSEACLIDLPTLHMLIGTQSRHVVGSVFTLPDSIRWVRADIYLLDFLPRLHLPSLAAMTEVKVEIQIPPRIQQCTTSNIDIDVDIKAETYHAVPDKLTGTQSLPADLRPLNWRFSQCKTKPPRISGTPSLVALVLSARRPAWLTEVIDASKLSPFFSFSSVDDGGLGKSGRLSTFFVFRYHRLNRTLQARSEQRGRPKRNFNEIDDDADSGTGEPNCCRQCSRSSRFQWCVWGLAWRVQARANIGDAGAAEPQFDEVMPKTWNQNNSKIKSTIDWLDLSPKQATKSGNVFGRLRTFHHFSRGGSTASPAGRRMMKVHVRPRSYFVSMVGVLSVRRRRYPIWEYFRFQTGICTPGARLRSLPVISTYEHAMQSTFPGLSFGGPSAHTGSVAPTTAPHHGRLPCHVRICTACRSPSRTHASSDLFQCRLGRGREWPGPNIYGVSIKRDRWWQTLKNGRSRAFSLNNSQLKHFNCSTETVDHFSGLFAERACVAWIRLQLPGTVGTGSTSSLDVGGDETIVRYRVVGACTLKKPWSWPCVVLVLKTFLCKSDPRIRLLESRHRSGR